MKKYFLATLLVIIILLPFLVLAQPPQQGLNDFLNETELKPSSLPEAIGRIVRIILSFLGLFTVLIIIFGVVRVAGSAGDEEQISNAKRMITAGVVGLIIIVLAYAVSAFVFSSLSSIVSG